MQEEFKILRSKIVGVCLQRKQTLAAVGRLGCVLFIRGNELKQPPS